MGWYNFRQNNSGGSFVTDVNRGIVGSVWIEADSADAANDKAEDIGIYFDGCSTGADCSCCGDRWHRAYDMDEESVNNIPVYTDYCPTSYVSFFFKDGTAQVLEISLAKTVGKVEGDTWYPFYAQAIEPPKRIPCRFCSGKYPDGRPVSTCEDCCGSGFEDVQTA